MATPIASLSLDLDNRWAYLRSMGHTDWQGESYLSQVVPRMLDFLGERDLRCTFFVVGEDLTRDEDARQIEAIATAGHEVANHSQSHYPWLDTLEAEQIESEVVDAEMAIEKVTGSRPHGFRAPGFSWSEELLALLVRRDYTYDASVFPTFVGPLARLYCKLTSFHQKSSDDQPQQRFSSLRDALRKLAPHSVATTEGPLTELPVTTMPIIRAPIHFTYVSFLAQRSPRLARAYWRSASRLCRWRGVGPSLLLHPLDFLGPDEEPRLARFPGMGLAQREKLELLSDVLRSLAEGRRVVSMGEHVAAMSER